MPSERRLPPADHRSDRLSRLREDDPARLAGPPTRDAADGLRHQRVPLRRAGSRAAGAIQRGRGPDAAGLSMLHHSRPPREPPAPPVPDAPARLGPLLSPAAHHNAPPP